MQRYGAEILGQELTWVERQDTKAKFKERRVRDGIKLCRFVRRP